MSKNFPTLLAPVLLLVGVVCLYLIFTTTLTPRESLMLGFIISAVSFIGSWILARAYSEETFTKNLRTFALKAAEKVNNLSNELDRLSVYLQEADDESAPASEQLLARDMRIDAAVHSINTLKSINDGSLSDWKGVIGEELDAQKEQREEREEEFRDIVERVELLLDDHDRTGLDALPKSSQLSTEVAQLRNELRLVTSQVSGLPVRKPKKHARDAVTKSCFVCGNPMKWDQKIKTGSYKGITCPYCSTKHVSRWAPDEAQFEVVLDQPVLETIACPLCTTDNQILVGLRPGQTSEKPCSHCDKILRASRYNNKVRCKVVGQPSKAAVNQVEISGEVLDQIKQGMPPQPWPTGTTKKLAEELGIPYPLARIAVKKLMDDGTFKLQIDGKLYSEVLSNAQGQLPKAP